MRPEPDKLFKNEAIYCNIILGQHIIPMLGIAMIKNEYDIMCIILGNTATFDLSGFKVNPYRKA